MLIGKEGLPGPELGWFGQIDEVRLWNRALSEEEIRCTMWTKLTGKEPGLVGYWNFDKGDASDNTSMGNNGIIHGNAVIVSSALFLATRPVLKGSRFVPQQGFEFVYETDSGVDYTVQASADFLTWDDIATLSSTTGSVRFLDAAAESFEKRFYRVTGTFSVPP